MTGRSFLAEAARRLTESGAADAGLDAEWMLCDALHIGRARMRQRWDDLLDDAQLVQLNHWLALRLRGLPLQYAQNRAHFMGHEFYVDERVLIPRQDTEILCEQALMRAKPGMRVLDLCTGSGALAVAIKLGAPGTLVTASDVSEAALDVARRNAQAHGVDIEFAIGDLFAALPGRSFDLIACNPPYIADADMGHLQAEVRFEPELALRGGPDGLSLYRRIAHGLAGALSPHGAALFEVGLGQAEPVRALMQAALPQAHAKVIKDLCGIDRVVIMETGV